MAASVIDGKAAAGRLRASVAAESDEFSRQHGRRPRLVVLIVGDNPASRAYVRTKTKMAVEAGLHVLLETPIAHKLSEADAIIAAANQRGLRIEVAEQFHRRPLEQIKLKLIDSGLFGKVYSSFNDFAGHGYHGVSVMRSYLGYDAKPVQVTGAVRQYDLASHWSRLRDQTGHAFPEARRLLPDRRPRLRLTRRHHP